MPNRVEIVLPGLFDLPLAELPPDFVERQLPRLNQLLRFSSPVGNRAHSIDAIVGRVLEWPERPSRSLPLARAHAGDDARDHLLAQPVYLHPDLQNAIVVPLEPEPRNRADIDTLIDDLGVMFRDDCKFTALAGGLYLLRLEAHSAPDHYPHILSVLGKPANPYFEQSRARLGWYRLLNEMQMFLHQHAVNQRRTGAGMLPINSLWCWGGGELPRETQAIDWYCDDPVLNRFAEAMGFEPAGLEELARAGTGRDAAVIDLRLLEATKTGQAAALDRLLREIEETIFAVVLNSAPAAVRLRAGFDYDFRFRPAYRWKFWRRRTNLSSWQAAN